MPAHLTFRERDEFRLRLRACLRDAGINPNRPGELLAAFAQASQGTVVTPSSVFKWLQGESLPSPNNMEIVASICKVCPTWLRTGQTTAAPQISDTEQGNPSQPCIITAN
jgi:hypothetical protein